ncbi:MAG: SpoIIE family protein phosphatase [Bacteroidota bacterium]
MNNIKIKVYGFIRTTKRQFIVIESVVIFLFIVAIILTLLYYNKPADYYTSDQDIFMARYGVFLWLFFITWCIIEAQFFLHRFTRAQLKIIEKQKEEINLHKEEIESQRDEIEAQRDQLEARNQEILQAKDEIEAQRDEIETHLEISEQQRELISHQKKELTDSINYAQRIQVAILPPDYYINKCLTNWFIFYMPKDVVSGDFYYIEKCDDWVIFAAVDCTGHGVPGSMMSVIGYNLINQAVKLNHINNPSEILQFLDAGVTETLRQTGGESGVNDGMDIAVCSLNVDNNILQFAGAYNSLIYVSKGILNEIKGDKLAIGVNYDGIVDQYSNHEVQLIKNDCIYLYSDGYADQFGGAAGKKFKYKPLKEMICMNAVLPVSVQKQILTNAFLEWKGGLDQVDDVLVMGIKI